MKYRLNTGTLTGLRSGQLRPTRGNCALFSFVRSTPYSNTQHFLLARAAAGAKPQERESRHVRDFIRVYKFLELFQRARAACGSKFESWWSYERENSPLFSWKSSYWVQIQAAPIGWRVQERQTILERAWTTSTLFSVNSSLLGLFCFNSGTTETTRFSCFVITANGFRIKFSFKFVLNSDDKNNLNNPQFAVYSDLIVVRSFRTFIHLVLSGFWLYEAQRCQRWITWLTWLLRRATNSEYQSIWQKLRRKKHYVSIHDKQKQYCEGKIYYQSCLCVSESVSHFRHDGYQFA